ncbi:MAG: hypothetical protein ACK5MT_05550 [Actinomycetales bacterium]
MVHTCAKSPEPVVHPHPGPGHRAPERSDPSLVEVAPTGPWTIVLPVRVGPYAKSRLGVRPGLVSAMVADCLDAVAHCPAVARMIVVRGPEDLAVPDRAEVVPEKVNGDPDRLNQALRAGIAGTDPPVAVLLADLPALTPRSLQAALISVSAAAHEQATPVLHVPDAEGTGTVLLASTDTSSLPLRFGPGSARAHEKAGSRPVAALARIRRDVDTAADLMAAWLLGVGERTRTRLTPMQVSVLDFDPASGMGHVVTDDGLRLPLSQTALVGSGLRHLRPGQRLSALLDTDDDGIQVVSAVRINGIGQPMADQP